MKVYFSGSVGRPTRFTRQYNRHIPVMGLNNLTSKEVEFIIKTSPNPAYTRNLLLSGSLKDTVESFKAINTNVAKLVKGGKAPKDTLQSRYDAFVKERTAEKEMDSLRKQIEGATKERQQIIDELKNAQSQLSEGSKAMLEAEKHNQYLVSELAAAKNMAAASQAAPQSTVMKYLPFAALAAIPLFLSGK